MGPLCTDFYLPSLPSIASALSASMSTSQLTLTAALIGLGAGQLFWGPASDRLGRVKPLLASLALFVLASVWCAYAHDIYQLIIARFIQGMAGAGGAVLARAIARDRYSGNELTRFFAVLMVVNGLAPIVAPIIGGALLGLMNWKGLFLTLSLASAILLVVSFYGLEETLSKKEKGEKPPGL
ncbi:MFS transporter [Sodalis ligni]|nr:MFS transporter [Sodalis ligni]QWA13230.1 MFS transporter [Sodalis ligni]